MAGSRHEAPEGIVRCSERMDGERHGHLAERISFQRRSRKGQLPYRCEPGSRGLYRGRNPNLGYDRPHGEMVAQFFDTSRFVQNAPGTFGNSGKNIIRGPRFFNTDVGLLKNNMIGERINVQFRAEFFNIFNNVNFNLPNANLSSGAQFGRITSALDPRILQFGLKMLF